jgi:hypothetical protein
MKRKVGFKKETHFGGKLQNVFISRIKGDERKLNTPYDKASIRFALHHLKVGHRVSPPVVEKLGKNKYRVVDGSHRLIALKRFGVKKARVEVV